MRRAVLGVALVIVLSVAVSAEAAKPRTIRDYIAGNTFVVGGVARRGSALTIRTGDRVVWTNLDATAHDVTFPSLGVSLYLNGRKTQGSLEFPSPGYYPYVCTIHASQQSMHGVVYVSDTAPV